MMRLSRLETRMRRYMKTVSTPNANSLYFRVPFWSVSTKRNTRIKLQKGKFKLHIRKKPQTFLM